MSLLSAMYFKLIFYGLQKIIFFIAICLDDMEKRKLCIEPFVKSFARPSSDVPEK